jgi:hypothetical protein
MPTAAVLGIARIEFLRHPDWFVCGARRDPMTRRSTAHEQRQ